MENEKATKPDFQKSEFWAAILTLISAIIGGLHGETKSRIIALTSALFISFVSEHPGWKTRAFWGSIASIVGSMALAVSEADIPGLPVGLTKAASMTAATVISAGYTVSRYTAKQLPRLDD